LYDLYTPLTGGAPTGNAFDDPLRCPTTGSPEDCGNNFRLLTGGNPNLDPETSRQFNAGVVWAPLNGLSLGANYWKISKTATIGPLASDDVFNHFDRFGATNIIRGPVDPAFPNLPGPIAYVVARTSNTGNLQTSGIDVDLSYRSPNTSIGTFTFNLNGTYIVDFQQQLLGGDETRSGVGAIVDLLTPGAIPRWKHYATLAWNNGPWGATLTQNFTQGYTDTNPDPAGNPRRVGTYDIWDVQGRCECFKNTSIVLGIKNLFDRAPPFSNQTVYSQVGYNPQYSDPLGRLFYAKLTVAFK
jgi:iron complex outermembrane receptor protein